MLSKFESLFTIPSTVHSRILSSDRRCSRFKPAQSDFWEPFQVGSGQRRSGRQFAQTFTEGAHILIGGKDFNELVMSVVVPLMSVVVPPHNVSDPTHSLRNSAERIAAWIESAV